MKRLLLIAICYAFLAAVSALGQTDQTPATGLPPFGSFQGSPDIVDLANLNVHFTMPILQKHGRRARFAYALGHENSVWFPVNTGSGGTFWSNGSNWGWSASARGLGSLLTGSNLVNCNGTVSTQVTFNNYIDANGTLHPFGTLLQTGGCSPNQVSGTTNDGSGYSLASNGSSASVQGPTGNTVAFPTTGQTSVPSGLTDANGNQLSFNGLLDSSSQPANGIVPAADTLGSAPLTISGQIPNPQSYQFPNTLGGTSAVTLSFKSYTFGTSFQCAGVGDVAATQTASFPDTITLPNGRTLHFAYETLPNSTAITGRLSSMTLSTGGVITYQYTGPNSGVNCADGSTMGLTRTTPDGIWTYVRSGSGSSTTTTVTDPLGNQTVYTFSGLYQTQVQVYQGTAASGKLLRTVITCYNGNTTNCVTASVSLPITKKSVTWILETNQQNNVTTFFNNLGEVTEKDEYDFGNGAPGRLLRQTKNSFVTLGNNIVKPSEVVINDGNSNKVADTTFGYDENSLTATSGLPQHAAVSGARGNLTSVHRWLNTNNSTITATSSYDDSGQVVSTTDANGNPTTYTYQCNGAYLMQSTLPKTSVSHTASFTANCNTGYLTKSTDQNGQQTQYAYDSMFRTTQITLPAQVVNGTAMSGLIQTSYNDIVGSLSAQQTGQQNASNSVVTTQFFDSLGRANSSQTTDAQGNVLTQVTFDALGRISTVANPYRSTSDTTYGITTTKYDALGRVTEVDRADGATELHTYNGNAEQIQDEGNGHSRVTRILQRDALGHLTAVCEVTSATSANGDTPANCNLQIAGTGFLTTYQYDTLGNLVTVQQGGATRSFTYDSLSRLVSMTNPESGTTTYTYDGNGNRITRTRPKQNQGTTNTTVTTTYAYDALNRLTSVTYNDSLTNSVTNHYDTSLEMGIGLDNTIGRLSAQYTTSPGGQIVAAKVYSYDAMGRLLNNSQCISQTCGGSTPTPYSIAYSYDLTGNELSATDGEGHTFNYTYDTVGRLTTMTSSLSDSNHPATLFSNPSYNPLGGLSSVTIGGLLNDAYAYDCRNRLVAYGSALAPATPTLATVTDSGCLVPVASNFERNPTAEIAGVLLAPIFDYFGFRALNGTSNGSEVSQ